MVPVAHGCLAPQNTQQMSTQVCRDCSAHHECSFAAALISSALSAHQSCDSTPRINTLESSISRGKWCEVDLISKQEEQNCVIFLKKCLRTWSLFLYQSEEVPKYLNHVKATLKIGSAFYTAPPTSEECGYSLTPSPDPVCILMSFYFHIWPWLGSVQLLLKSRDWFHLLLYSSAGKRRENPASQRPCWVCSALCRWHTLLLTWWDVEIASDGNGRSCFLPGTSPGSQFGKTPLNSLLSSFKVLPPCNCRNRLWKEKCVQNYSIME